MNDVEVVGTPQPLLTRKLYDILKFLAQVAIPAVGTFYATVAGLWNFPHPLEVVGSLAAVDTLLGALLALDSVKFKSVAAVLAAAPPVTDGVLNISRAEGTIALNVGLDKLPEELAQQTFVTFQVNDLNKQI